MSVNDGQDVSALVTNAAFISTDQGGTTTGKVNLQNTDAESGGNVDNIQRELNGLNSYTGSGVGSLEDRKPAWNDNSIGAADNSLKDRADLLTTQVDTNRTDIATNASNIASNDADIATNQTNIADTKTALGISNGDTDMGPYTGNVITDNSDQVAINQQLSDAIEAIPSGLVFQGNWNADTNSPALSSGVGTQGHYYIVSVAGSTNLDGETDWGVGDWAVFSNGAWYKIDNSETVTSVNGQTGTVVLDADDISDAATTNKFNQTHTGDATGDTALTLQGAAISGKATEVPEAGDFILFSDTSDSGNLKKVDYGDLEAGGSGSGQGGINYIGLSNQDNTDFEGGTVGDWVTYADAAGTEPVDGIGGTASFTTFTATTVTPLRGTTSGLLSKSASNSQGEGASIDFSIDRQDVEQPLYVSFDFESSGAYLPDDVIPYVYDVTNATLIGLSRNSSNKRFTGRFQASDATSYRLILHIASTNALAWDLRVDQIVVGPTSIVDVASEGPIGEIIAFANDSVPTGFLYCDGTPVSRSIYSELFSVIGTTWGSGDGSTTFNVPDLQNEFLRGDGSQAVGGTQVDGTAKNGLSVSVSGAHDHELMAFGQPGATPAGIAGTVGASGYFLGSPPFIGTGSSAHSHTLVSSDGETRPANKKVKYCIRYSNNSLGLVSDKSALNETPRARLTLTAAASHTNNGGVQNVPFDTVDYDKGGLVSGASFVIREDGEYTIKHALSAGAYGSSSNTLSAQILVNSSLRVDFAKNPVSTTIQNNAVCEATLNLSAGDVVEAQCFQNSGGNLAYRNVTDEMYFEIKRVVDLDVYASFNEPFKTQTKFLTADVSTDSTISDLTFTNLKSGQWYEIEYQFKTISSAFDNVSIDFEQNAGADLLQRLGINFSVASEASSENGSLKFQSDGTDLIFVVSSLTGGFVAGNSTKAETFVTLSETDPRIDTNEW